MKKLGLKLIIIIVSLLAYSKNVISVAPYFLVVLILAYFGMPQKHIPGSLYNELHTLTTGRKYQKVALQATSDFKKFCSSKLNDNWATFYGSSTSTQRERESKSEREKASEGARERERESERERASERGGGRGRGREREELRGFAARE